MLRRLAPCAECACGHQQVPFYLSLQSPAAAFVDAAAVVAPASGAAALAASGVPVAAGASAAAVATPAAAAGSWQQQLAGQLTLVKCCLSSVLWGCHPQQPWDC